MIKAKDLMLGNWVEYATGLNKEKRSIPMYVTGIFSDTVYLNFDGNEGDVFEEEEKDLLGIPITKEILERNGIKLIEVGDNGIGTPKRLLNRYEKWMIHTTWRDDFIWFDRITKRWKLHGMNEILLDYVHELQNAYRILTKKELEVKL